MKKLLIALLVLLILFIGSAFIFIPDIIHLSQETIFPASKKGLHRLLGDSNSWAAWFPFDDSTQKNNLTLHGNRFHIPEKQPVTIDINIDGNVKAKTSINLVPLVQDSISVVWTGAMITSYNPFARVQAYFRSKKLKADMEAILLKMQKHFINPENIYGVLIRHETVSDSLLTSTIFTTNGYPSTEKIYEQIAALRKFAESHSARAGFPMLNVTTADSIKFDAMVALPVDKALPNTSVFTTKKMITGAHILTSEVTGDEKKVAEAFKRVQQFVEDYQLTAPAIPFVSLISDRREEPDSRYWVTKVYFPVM